MRRGSALLVVSLTAGLAILFAADFWKEKKFTDWSDKEVQKMLTDSPWARKTGITLTMPSGGRGGARNAGSSFASAQDEGERPTGGMGGMGGGMRGGGMGGGIPMPALEVTVRWHSALPIKQAVIRERHRGQPGVTEEESKLLAREESVYIAGVIGVPGPGVGVDAKELAAAAQLRIEGQTPIQAASVQMERSPRGTNFYFIFPKRQEGAHVITLDDKEVEFFLKSKTMAVKRKFKLRDMVYEGKLEI